MKNKGLIFCIAWILLSGIVTPMDGVQAKVALNKKKATITVGKTVTLKLSGTKKKVKWSTSSKKIATVSAKGKVKGKKAGKATITARVGKKQYQCKVTVKNKKSQNPTEGQDVVPGEETRSADAGEYSIDNVHTGYATFYDRVSGGAANLDYLEESYYTAAMNNADYMNGLAGAFIEVTDKDGDKLRVVITDRLPEGAKGDIDLSRAAFQKIEPLVTGKMKITWKIVPFPVDEPVSYVFKPTSTRYWAEVQVRNGRYPIKKLEYYDKSAGKYVELPRQEYNYFTAASGMGEGPYTFRVTDFYGHVLVDTNIAINSSATPVKGKANFPY